MIKSAGQLWMIVVATLIMSCSTPKALEYYSYRNLSVERLGFTNSQVKLELEYFNPNNFGLQVRRTELDIFIDSTLLGHSSLDTLINIPRRDTFLLPINFNVDMQNLFKNAWNSFTGNEVSIKVIGKLKIGKANIFMSMPVNYEGKYKFSLF